MAGRMHLLVHTQLEGTAMKGVTWHGKRDVRVDTVREVHRGRGFPDSGGDGSGGA